MINNDRIVPVQAIDRLSFIGEVMTLANISYTVQKAENIEGDFKIATTGNKLCNQLVKSMNFTAASGTVYFIPSFAFAGFKINGTATAATGTVTADGSTLFKAVLADSAITVTQITPAVPA